jgi:hypothetical protein
MPNWNDVRWNSGVARQAEWSLRDRARLLDETIDLRMQLADRARREWRGPYRDEFDRKLNHMVSRGRQLAQEMRAKADEIRRATARAEAEQRRREEERRRWEREHEDD